MPSLAKRIAAGFLAGCLAVCAAPRAAAASQDPFGLFGGGEPWYEAAPRTKTQQAYGSAGLIAFPSVLVSVYLDEEDGAAWDDASIARSRRQLATAVDWITEQCAAYNACPDIRYDDGTQDSPLFVHRTYRGRFEGGEDGETSETFYLAVDALCDLLDTDALHARYGTASVGFLFFLPVAGSAFTTIHPYEDGDSFYYEYCCLYRYDVWSGGKTWDGPAAYAHEILHLFGAPDLYEGSSDPFVTPALADYVAQSWPDAIMADTYAPDGSIRYDAVGKTLSPLTACRLGLCRTWPGLEEYPASMYAPAGVFTTDNIIPDFDEGSVAA